MLAPHLDKLREDLAGSLAPAAAMLEAQAKLFGDRLASPIERFANSVGQLPPAFGQFQHGVDAIGRIGQDIRALGSAGESLERGMMSLSRIESALTQQPEADPRLDEIQRGVRSLSRIESVLTQEPEADPRIEEIQRGLDRACVAIENLGNSWASAYEKSSRSTQEQLAKTLNSLKDALELINVSMEQGNSLYRSIVKKMFDERANSSSSSRS